MCTGRRNDSYHEHHEEARESQENHHNRMRQRHVLTGRHRVEHMDVQTKQDSRGKDEASHVKVLGLVHASHFEILASEKSQA